MYNFTALLCGLMFCSVVRVLYEIVDWSLAGNPLYAALARYRKMYVQKNMVKSFVLALLLPPSMLMVVYPVWSENAWHTARIQYFAVAYGANDFVGLVCVDKLPRTTVLHHLISTSLVLLSLSMDFQVSPVAQSMFVYTFFAASSYIVNFHLSVRWLFPRGQQQRLRQVAAVVYAVSCSLSWCWQLHWMYVTELQWYYLVYIALMLCIVRDDIILMQWLTSI